MSLAQLSQLLPLPTEELQQVLDYAGTLSKPDAASHFSNLLGDSPLAVEFISAFNARRQTPSSNPGPSKHEDIDAVPKSKRAPKKAKPPLHTPQARQVESYAGPSGAVYSRSDDDYGYGGKSSKATPGSSAAPSPKKQPPKQQPPKQHASSAGFLVGDALSKKPKANSNPTSRSSTPKPAGSATKISISGGTPMAGQSTAIADLDAAIRALETSTNPSLDNPKARRCNCVATRHPLQTAAPNCLSCGKVICAKEGLGPCTFCGASLLSSDDVQAMVRQLKDDRGKEKMAANAAANRRAEISQKPAPFSQNKVSAPSTEPSLSEAADKARMHRDKLLNFQAQNARRTTVRDEAADFDVSFAASGSGGSMWSTPEERAQELKRQQKLLREMEWNARPEYEKRQQVLSIDIVNGKVVRKMAPAERPKTPEDEEDNEPVTPPPAASNVVGRTGGAFSANPLLGSIMKPVFQADEGALGRKDAERAGRTKWRRVQDSMEDNENVILDGGIRGHVVESTCMSDEPACG